MHGYSEPSQYLHELLPVRNSKRWLARHLIYLLLRQSLQTSYEHPFSSQHHMPSFFESPQKRQQQPLRSVLNLQQWPFKQRGSSEIFLLRQFLQTSKSHSLQLLKSNSLNFSSVSPLASHKLHLTSPTGTQRKRLARYFTTWPCSSLQPALLTGPDCFQDFYSSRAFKIVILFVIILSIAFFIYMARRSWFGVVDEMLVVNASSPGLVASQKSYLVTSLRSVEDFSNLALNLKSSAAGSSSTPPVLFRCCMTHSVQLFTIVDLAGTPTNGGQPNVMQKF